MKKFSFLAMAAVAALFSSCSSELVPEEVPGTGNEIRVRATAESNTRAVTSYCANNLPDEFQVWATTEANELYIKNATATGTQGKYEFSENRYWPQSGVLNFLAYRNAGDTFTGADNPGFKDYAINDEVAQQLDLIYAVNNGATKDAGTVKLNFRHALSQVVFRAQVTNPSLKVYVSGVTIGNLKSEGTYTFPENNTDVNWLDPEHSDVVNNPEDNSGVGTWALKDGKKAYSIDTKEGENGVAVSYTDPEITKLSESPANHKGDWSKVMILMPQQQEAWNPASGSISEGTYIKVDCKIVNVVDDTEVTINEKPIYVPLAINWKQGVRYIYTMKFGDGYAGYVDPGEDPDPENPNPNEPTLTKIDVEGTTDDFKSESEVKNGYEYSVKFNVDDDVTNAPSKLYACSHDASYTFTIPATTSMKKDKGRYDFDCWTIEGTGNIINADDEVTVTAKQPIAYLQANWKLEHKKLWWYSTYDANGGTMPNVDDTCEEGPFGEKTQYIDDVDITGAYAYHTYTFKVNNTEESIRIPSRPGYKFIGWKIDGREDIFENQKSYAFNEKDGAYYEDSSDGKGKRIVFIFKAVWEKE